MNARNIRGLGDIAIRTQPEVAKIMGITQQYVAKLEKSALRKIRQRMESYVRENKQNNP